MGRDVVKAQNVSRMCFLCGTENEAGMHARFYEVEGGEVVCVFSPADHHQGYPGRLHGGISSAILDETIGRAISIEEPDTWYVTVELTVRMRKPVPVGEELHAIGRVIGRSSRLFEGTGEILLADGTVAAEASARYMRMPPDKIVSDDFVAAEWYPDERAVPESIDLA